jgi:heme-degrading monooxygenase HmoA
MYASLTTTHGSNENLRALAALVGETMDGWLHEIDGFEGLFVLADEQTGTTRVLTLWESREVAEEHEEARRQFRERITATVDVEIQGVDGYDVAFAHFAGVRESLG